MSGTLPTLTELIVYRGDKPASVSTKQKAGPLPTPGTGLWKRECALQRPSGASSKEGVWRALTLLSTQVPLQGFVGRWTCRSSAWMEEPPAVSLLQDWSRHPQGTKGVGAGDTPDRPAVLLEPSTTVSGQQEAGGGAA